MPILFVFCKLIFKSIYNMLSSIRLTVFMFCLAVLGCKDSTTTKEEQSKPIKVETKNVKQNPMFTMLSPNETGIKFNNINTDTDGVNYYKYEYFYNGGGVAVADFNNDGLQDIYFTANMASNMLFINSGDLKFVNITGSANINSGEQDWCTGVTIVDINKDGWQDIFVSRSGWFKNENAHKLRNLLYVNNGDLTFTERGLEYGFADLSSTTQTCFFDADNDGDLDAYQINHPTLFKNFKAYKDGSFFKSTTKESVFSDKFYLNVNGKYIDKTNDKGFVNAGHSLGIISSDFNNDGWQDLYISNDYTEPDYIYINQKNGEFKNEKLTAFKHMSKFSMGVDVADINNDGLQDIFNAEMLAKDNYSKKTNMASMNPILYWAFVKNGDHYQDMHNSLQLNNGNGTFSEISWLSNIAESDWSWCPLIADFDNDGYKDLFISNGSKRDVLSKDSSKEIAELIRKDGNKKFSEFEHLIPSKKVSNVIFKNNKDLTFTDKTDDWGMRYEVNSNGAAYADLDNDGDLDLIINNINHPALIFRNENVKANNFIDFNLTNKSIIAYGSKIEILDSNNYQVSELTNSRGFQSISESKLHFGLGKSNKIDSLLITWSNGKQTLLKNLKINELHQIDFNNSSFINLKKNDINETYFVDKTKAFNLKYTHRELEYDDYLKEILLPHKLSQEGPFIGVADVNGDGLEDFFVGNGIGFSGELYIQTSSGGFNLSKQKVFNQDKLCEDLGALFFDYDNDGDKDLYVVSGSNEYELESPFMQDRLYENDGQGNFTKTQNVLPVMQASGSCVKSADFDNDGDLDLFVGGFLLPNQYPKPGKSFLLLNDNGTFKDVTNTIASGLQDIGMVKDAAFADINGDDKIDLIVTGQWMPIEVFINNGKQFEKRTNEYGLSEEVGWWNTLLIEDLDNDGFLDIVAGNLGTNTKHKASKKEPFKIYADDFDYSGSNDIVLGYYNQGTLYPVRGKQCSSEQIPSINDKVKSYNEFGQLNLEQIYGNDKLDRSTHYNATNFKTSIFKNVNGETFIVESLPNQLQFAPTNAIIKLDINKDGINDLIAVGNHHPVEVETGRYDAHIGNVLINQGNFILKNESLVNTGFFANNDNRDIKKITIKNKEYLIISSNRNKIQFFQIN